uniref:Uncharacterized protein n=1 Tax=Fagus sylvatica TaxID=28930 RepID=A0A2N9GXX1_FAGSY
MDAPKQEGGQEETSSSKGPPVENKNLSISERLHGPAKKEKRSETAVDKTGNKPPSEQLHGNPGDKKTHGTTAVQSEGGPSASEELRDNSKKVKQNTQLGKKSTTSAPQLLSDRATHQSHLTSNNKKQRDSASATIKLLTGGEKHDNKSSTGETSQSENQKASDDENATNPQRSEKPKKATQNDGKKSDA